MTAVAAPTGVRGRIEGITGSAPFFPLLLLFLLNLVDELDRTAYTVLAPEIKEAFGLSTSKFTAIAGSIAPLTLLLSIPIGYMADRRNRVKMTRYAALGWAGFALLTGLGAAAGVLAFFWAARAGSSTAKIFNDTHRSLLADYYPAENRTRVFYAHMFANPVGQLLGALSVTALGIFAAGLVWWAPFVVLAVPTVLVVVLSATLREPIRGRNERLAAGADETTADFEDKAAGLKETFKTLYAQTTARRIYWSLPFLAGSMLGFASIMSLFYDEVYNVDSKGRGLISAATEPASVIGIVFGITLLPKIVGGDPGKVLRLLGISAIATATCMAGIALSPWIGGAIAFQLINAAIGGLLLPGVMGVISLIVPPRMRSLGFATGSLWLAMGLPVILIVGTLADAVGFRAAILVFIPIYFIGSYFLVQAGKTMNDDIVKVNMETLARAQAAQEQGE